LTQTGANALEVGSELPKLVKEVTQEKVNRYADASGDHNPLHVDPEFAATTQFEGTIAHGMLVLAYLSEMLTAAFGQRWLDSGRLKIRFRAPARPGDTITSAGTVTRVDGENVSCGIECKNQTGEVLISGQAEVSG
jgi:3-hydroxybutyryl-CoA dehydratase